MIEAKIRIFPISTAQKTDSKNRSHQARYLVELEAGAGSARLEQNPGPARRLAARVKEDADETRNVAHELGVHPFGKHRLQLYDEPWLQ